MTHPQQRLFDRLPPSGEWVKVPTATRGTTIAAMVRKGIIEHRRDPERGHWMDWLIWGEVRRKPSTTP